MLDRAKLIACLTVPVLSAASVTVDAQTLVGSRISRPTSQSPSQRLGLLGGRATRTFGSAASLSTHGASGGGLGDLPAFSLRSGGTAPAPAAFQLGRPGFQNLRGASSSVFRYGQLTGTARIVSGLDRATSTTAALRVRGPDTYDFVASTPYILPPREQSAFHSFFDLKPKVPEALAGASVKAPTAMARIERLEAGVKAQNEQSLTRAHAAFKRGTTPTEEAQQEQLAKAIDLYSRVIRTDPERPLPMILLIHASLAKAHVVQAEWALAQLAQRHPEALVNRPDISEYFGDPAGLTKQMVEYLRVGEMFPDDSLAMGLQAYCAWTLEDDTRMRSALDEMDRMGRQKVLDERVRAIQYALQVALDRKIAAATRSPGETP